MMTLENQVLNNLATLDEEAARAHMAALRWQASSALLIVWHTCAELYTFMFCILM